MTVARIAVRRRWPDALVVSGAALLVLGVSGAGAAAVWARTHAEVLASPPASPLALQFAPPDDTASWIWIAVAAVGLVAVIAGIVSRRRTGRDA